MLTARSWDNLPFPDTYKNGHREEMSKIKIGNFPISAYNYHRSSIFMSIYMFFEGANHNEIGFKELTQHKKGSKSEMAANIVKKNHHFPGSNIFVFY